MLRTEFDAVRIAGDRIVDALLAGGWDFDHVGALHNLSAHTIVLYLAGCGDPMSSSNRLAMRCLIEAIGSRGVELVHDHLTAVMTYYQAVMLAIRDALLHPDLTPALVSGPA
jgi:hypothetical protein